MKELLTYLAKSLVRFPDEVVVTEKVLEDNTLEYTLKVNPEDMGRVIGKNGKTAQALRMLVSARGSLEKKRTRVEIEQES
ncbi:MAG: KH domain-containing protein [bacterium]|jgi:predicted RNA-binding protein YlqC (UPF0109 family)